MYGQDQRRQSKPDRDYHTLTIRVPPTLHQSIEAIADRDCESVAAIVRRLLRVGVQQQVAAHG